MPAFAALELKPLLSPQVAFALLVAVAALAALLALRFDAEALAAYADLAANLPMSDRLKADVLEQASLCAGRLKDHRRAMQLAKSIPVQPIAIDR